MVSKKTDPIFENATKVTKNKVEFRGSTPCERVLGGQGNLILTAGLSIGYSEVIGIITAHLVLKYVFGEKERDSKEINAYKQFGADFIKFLTETTIEHQQKIAQRQKDTQGKKKS